MADEARLGMSEDNPTMLRVIVSALSVTYVMAFLSGFLQDTPFNFVNYIFFSLLFIGGIALVRATRKSGQTAATKGFLFLTGVSSTLLLVLFVGYEWFRLQGNGDLEASLEALLYGTTLLFWVGAIGSLVLIRKRP